MEKKRIIFELSKLMAANPSGNLTSLTTFSLNQWGYGVPLVDGNYVAIDTRGSVRIYKDGNYFTVPSMQTYECWNLSTVKTFHISSYTLTNGTSKGNLSCISKDSSNNTYLMAGLKRYPLSGTANLQATSSPDDTLITRIPAAAFPSVIKSPNGAELSMVENNMKRPIPSMAVFSQLGYGSGDITVIPPGAYVSLVSGAKKLTPGTLLLEPTGAVSVATSDAGRLQITSPTQFENFAYSWNKLLRVNAVDLAAHPSSGNLPIYLQSGGNLYLVDAKVRYLIDPSLDAAFGLNRASILTVDSSLINNTLTWRMTRFVKSVSTSAVYYMDNGQKRPISSWQRVVELGGANQIDVFSDGYIRGLPTGPGI